MPTVKAPTVTAVYVCARVRCGKVLRVEKEYRQQGCLVLTDELFPGTPPLGLASREQLQQFRLWRTKHADVVVFMGRDLGDPDIQALHRKAIVRRNARDCQLRVVSPMGNPPPRSEGAVDQVASIRSLPPLTVNAPMDMASGMGQAGLLPGQRRAAMRGTRRRWKIWFALLAAAVLVWFLI